MLVIDVESQRAVVESFNLFPKYITIDRVIRPTRLLCFAAKFVDEDRVRFFPAWDDDDLPAYERMVHAAWALLDEADIVVGWNNTRYDDKYFNAAFGKLGLGPVSPYKSLDLMQVAKKNFAAGELSLKLDWFSRMWLGDAKTNHGGTDLWHDIRYGTRAERRAAQKIMRTYNIHDVELTAELYHKFLPWSNINMGIYHDDGVPHCSKCGGTDLRRSGFHYTSAGKFQEYRCRDKDCRGWSRGSKRLATTELRSA